MSRELLDFDDAGAQDDYPAKGVTVGDIRAWFDEIERLTDAVRRIDGINDNPANYNAEINAVCDAILRPEPKP